MSTYFMDIGNTNFKIANDTKSSATQIYPINQLIDFLNSFNFKDNKLFVLNNNLTFKTLLIELSQENKNLKLFTYNTSLIGFNLDSKFKVNEIGNDLWFLIYYLNHLSSHNAIVVSVGSCLVSIVKKDGVIISISINLGLSKNLEVLNQDFGLVNIETSSTSFGVDTSSSLNLGLQLLLDGVVTGNCHNFHLNNPEIIFCGNGLIKKWHLYLINNYPTMTYKPNLVLDTFKTWCLEKR